MTLALPKGRARHLQLGRRGERLAAKLLTVKGLELLTRNWRCRSGELDLVMRDGMTLVFVEVKTRRHRGNRRPAANLSSRQRQRNFRAGELYFRRIGQPNLVYRFDLVEVVLDRRRLVDIRHWPNYWSSQFAVIK